MRTGKKRDHGRPHGPGPHVPDARSAEGGRGTRTTTPRPRTLWAKDPRHRPAPSTAGNEVVTVLGDDIATPNNLSRSESRSRGPGWTSMGCQDVPSRELRQQTYVKQGRVSRAVAGRVIDVIPGHGVPGDRSSGIPASVLTALGSGIALWEFVLPGDMWRCDARAAGGRMSPIQRERLGRPRGRYRGPAPSNSAAPGILGGRWRAAQPGIVPRRREISAGSARDGP